MSENIKRRSLKAKNAAMDHYRGNGYRIIPGDNNPICFSAVDKAGTHERKVRVVIDKITKADIDSILAFRIPPGQIKEIICRPYGGRVWKKLIYDHMNFLCQ
jgi:hypothetical protein